MQGRLRSLCKRVPGVQYLLEHHCGFFYVLTNASLSEDKESPNENYYLGRCQVKDTHFGNWQRFRSDKDKLISNLKTIQDYLCSFKSQGYSSSYAHHDEFLHDVAVPVKSRQKEKQSKRGREGPNEPDRKVKQQKGKKGSGFLAPLPLSDALVNFFGTGESELSRADVVKRMWEYIKKNDLQLIWTTNSNGE
ncbi:hypothetical protein LOK49_LG03G00957 [Camellia lanceoleosa]|uniref:Uncharacterized protein n=1 Tax=Camellia lanceoleosa TaxID=1840588 RepID=A0ACC0IFD6_9ERIC|nr:hypothetical protein LOK49_LG03G00957 [Camellia lanceoleosa]